MGSGLVIRDCDDWSARRFHRVTFGEGISGARAWRMTDQGVLVQGEPTERRTKGQPTTVARIVASYGQYIDTASELTGVPRQLIAAVIATETGSAALVDGRLVYKRRDPKTDKTKLVPATRFEAHLNDWSFGLMQTLTRTARALALQAPPKLGLEGLRAVKAVPDGGSADQWRELLERSETSIRLGALYLSQSNQRWSLQWDPVLLYVTYNAGSFKPGSPGNLWGVHAAANGDVLDHLAAWYGDACAVYGEC